MGPYSRRLDSRFANFFDCVDGAFGSVTVDAAAAAGGTATIGGEAKVKVVGATATLVASLLDSRAIWAVGNPENVNAETFLLAVKHSSFCFPTSKVKNAILDGQLPMF